MCIGTITLTYTTLLIHHTCTRLEVKAGSCKVCVHESNSVQSRQLRFFLWDWLIALSVSHWLSLALNRYVCTRTCSFWVGSLNHLQSTPCDSCTFHLPALTTSLNLTSQPLSTNDSCQNTHRPYRSQTRRLEGTIWHSGHGEAIEILIVLTQWCTSSAKSTPLVCWLQSTKQIVFQKVF